MTYFRILNAKSLWFVCVDIPGVGLVCAWECRIISVTSGVCVREQDGGSVCVCV